MQNSAMVRRSASATKLAGERFRYRLREIVGSGATSQVWLADDATAERSVALKIARSPAHAQRLADEAERLLWIDSPALGALLGAGVLPDAVAARAKAPPGAPYLTLEWVDGAPLDVTAERSSAGRVALALAVAADVARALGDLHAAGSAHGDVKPDNILVRRVGRGRTAHWEAKLVDLGLSDAADTHLPRGGTPRYLAPEVFAEGASDGRARDLWALGLTLAEIASQRVARARTPRDAIDVAALPEPLTVLIAPLLSAAPGARPSAQWVGRAALGALGRTEDAAAARDRRRRAVCRAYLAVRRTELLHAARSAVARVRVAGEPGRWVEDAVGRARDVARLRGALIDREPPELDELDELGRARWLVALVGSAATAWPALHDGSDADLAGRLLELAERAEPQSWSLADLERRSQASRPRAASAVELALALGAGCPTPELLNATEARVLQNQADPALGLALARALRLGGQFGRALAVLSRVEGDAAQAEAAETLRRAGDASGALELLEKMSSALDPEVRARRAATLGRIHVDRGAFQTALDVLGDAPETAATLEVRALAELALGTRGAAQRTLSRARLLAENDEERARVEAVQGYVAHAAGNVHGVLEAYSRAAEHAARAGAVLEEAVYLTGVAAAATDAGELAQALNAARRATLLFEHLDRPRDAARAALARASVYAIAGATSEARDAANEAIARARAAGDARCRGLAHLAIADALPLSDPLAVEHAERARTLLEDGTDDDALHVAARLFERGGSVDVVKCDASARDPARALDARLEWWSARARVEADRATPARPDVILAELAGLLTTRAPLAVRGRAAAAGAQLAARSGDGEGARRFSQAAGEAARQLVRHAPPALKVAIGALDWVARAEAPHDSEISPEQVSDVETLVRALGSRDRLRPLLDQVLDALVLWTGVERGLLLLRAPGERLVVRAARNLAKHDLSGVQLELSHSLAERALAERQPVVAVDATGELPEVHQSVHALKLRSVLAVPLIARGAALGVVYLDDRERRGAFGPRELAWVRLVATIAAAAIGDARDQLTLRRAARRARRAEARLGDMLARREAELGQAERELRRARDARDTRFAYDATVGQSGALLKMLRVVDRVTASEVPVLLVGESGSGKELVARAIHDNGPRRSKPFVSENCAAIPEPLLESTLFGHVRGAFTGASRGRAGLFEVAHEGTLFLDEIGEMSLAMQAKLLRVLEEGELRPVGSEGARRVSTRVIAATHRDLHAMAEAGTFRQDLLYRLDVISVRVPPLRERQGDVALLVRHFVDKYARGRPLEVEPAALRALEAYAWPGNVRQLQNEIRRAIVLTDDSIGLEHLSREVRDLEVTETRGNVLDVKKRVDALEAELVKAALAQTDGNQTRAAELLGLSRFGLQKMMRRLAIGLPPSGRRRAVGVGRTR
jgi:transcriptional regulator with GAF, ATPase, and Fis domain/serine/threonine protein kinase/tetratricopeptide (TPR) repeat protein